ncbi:hypothetical protein F7725_023132 [Dissostichus mawsoni]|uniref:Uncharacterized protein n=1 Tax=Dissostichus mawsoni TaxID=36200 RepID=A0A7J5Z2R4_DISMA|nr:hypothetical protein F7725_023132 [Dissostichus mawsoni]
MRAVWIQPSPSSVQQQRPVHSPETAPPGGNLLTKHRPAQLARPAHGRSSTMAEDLGVPLSYTNNRCSVAGALSRMEIDARFRYYFQHPWSRLIVAYLVTFFNFLIFAEDPISHSQTEAHMIVVGNCFSFLFNKYPGLEWNALKRTERVQLFLQPGN